MNQEETFTNAYKNWTGKKWEWKKLDGSQNHPMDSNCELDKAFYIGFCLAKKENSKLTKEFDSVAELKIRLINLENNIKNFRKNK